MQRSLVLFAMVIVVALIAVASASQLASAHDKVHTTSTLVSTTAVHHKAHTVVDPQAHGIPLLNATALKKELTKEVKGPYGESDVIGGMMSGGY